MVKLQFPTSDAMHDFVDKWRFNNNEHWTTTSTDNINCILTVKGITAKAIADSKYSFNAIFIDLD